MISDASTNLGDKESTWRPAELVRELAAVVPTDTTADADRLAPFLGRLADHIIATHCTDLSRPIPPGVPLRRDGRPVTESAVDRVLTTPAILAQEERLLAWAERRYGSGTDHPHAPARSVVPLNGPQGEVAAAVAGSSDLVLVVGPAGTGKTTALAPAVAQLDADYRYVFGVAPSAAAADVLAAETGVEADTVDKLLTEHTLHRPPADRYRLPAGTTVLVDEAAMVPTAKLAELAALADTHRWRVVLVGDPLQFSAVGRGGMFTHLLQIHGGIELDRVHRFTHDWEAAASLRLRHGDPRVANLYHAHGRLHGGTTIRMETEAVAAWHHARRRGDTALLAAPTTDTVQRLNQRAQQLLIDTGHLNPTGGHLTVGPSRVHVGDEIVTRRNHRTLRTDRGYMIRNRDTWTITALHADGTITATGRTGSVHLPAGYVTGHVELGYAQTSHASQGRTVDHAHLVLDGPCDARGLYVPLTRGRHSNHAYITTTGEQTPADVFTASLTRTWIDRPATAHRDRHNARKEVLPRPAAAIDDPRARTSTRRASSGTWPRPPLREKPDVLDLGTVIGQRDARLRERQHARPPSTTREEPDLGIEL